MPSDITLGDNYNIQEDGNGNLVITDSTGTAVLEHTDGGAWDIQRNINHNQNDVSGVDLLETEQISNSTQSSDPASPTNFVNVGSGGDEQRDQYVETTVPNDNTANEIYRPGKSTAVAFVTGLENGVGYLSDIIQVRNGGVKSNQFGVANPRTYTENGDGGVDVAVDGGGSSNVDIVVRGFAGRE